MSDIMHPVPFEGLLARIFGEYRAAGQVGRRTARAWADHRNYGGCLRTQSADLDRLIEKFNTEVVAR